MVGGASRAGACRAFARRTQGGSPASLWLPTRQRGSQLLPAQPFLFQTHLNISRTTAVVRLLPTLPFSSLSSFVCTSPLFSFQLIKKTTSCRRREKVMSSRPKRMTRPLPRTAGGTTAAAGGWRPTRRTRRRRRWRACRATRRRPSRASPCSRSRLEWRASCWSRSIPASSRSSPMARSSFPRSTSAAFSTAPSVRVIVATVALDMRSSVIDNGARICLSLGSSSNLTWSRRVRGHTVQVDGR